MEHLAFKIVVLGTPRCGKTTFIHRHVTGEYKKEYIPTNGIRVVPLTFYVRSNAYNGPIQLIVWDIGGSYMDPNVMLDASGAIVMGHMNDNVTQWTDMIHAIPLVLCATKQDDKDRPSVSEDSPLVQEMRRLHCPFFHVSARGCYNFEKPFLALIRRLLADESLVFTEAPSMTPPMVHLH